MASKGDPVSRRQLERLSPAGHFDATTHGMANILPTEVLRSQNELPSVVFRMDRRMNTPLDPPNALVHKSADMITRQFYAKPGLNRKITHEQTQRDWRHNK
jgi:hypothetical protein